MIAMSWTMTWFVVGVAVGIATILFMVAHLANKKRRATTQRQPASTSTPPAQRGPEETRPTERGTRSYDWWPTTWKVVWSLVGTLIGIWLALWVYQGITKLVDTPINSTKQWAPPTSLPSQEKQVRLEVNDGKWTSLPKSMTGKYHFVVEQSWVQLRIRCVDFLVDGTPKIVGEYDFGGEAGSSLKLPVCTEIQVKTKKGEATVIWWQL